VNRRPRVDLALARAPATPEPLSRQKSLPPPNSPTALSHAPAHSIVINPSLVLACVLSCIQRLRSPAVARIADRTGCQWPSRSSEVDFILSDRAYATSYFNTYSNLGPISHRFREMASFPTKKRTFFLPLPFNPKFENVSLTLSR